jgi:hypothetical protein
MPFAWPAIEPLNLTLTRIRLDPVGFVAGVVLTVFKFALFYWVFRELGRKEVREAIDSAELKRGDMRWPAASRIVLVIALGISLNMFFQDTSVQHAKLMAEAQVGSGYQFHVSSLTVSSVDESESAFRSQRLSVETASSLFGVPKLLLNDVVVHKQKRRYPVMADSGAEMLIQMKFNMIDPVPTLVIDEDTFKLVEPLEWYEYAWSGLPIILVSVGGALGGFLGGVATMANGRIFRSDRGALARYGLTGLISIVAAIAYFGLAVVVQLLLRSRSQQGFGDSVASHWSTASFMVDSSRSCPHWSWTISAD